MTNHYTNMHKLDSKLDKLISRCELFANTNNFKAYCGSEILCPSHVRHGQWYKVATRNGLMAFSYVKADNNLGYNLEDIEYGFSEWIYMGEAESNNGSDCHSWDIDDHIWTNLNYSDVVFLRKNHPNKYKH